MHVYTDRIRKDIGEIAGCFVGLGKLSYIHTYFRSTLITINRCFFSRYDQCIGAICLLAATAEFYGIAQLGERISMKLRGDLFESIIRRDIGMYIHEYIVYYFYVCIRACNFYVFSILNLFTNDVIFTYICIVYLYYMCMIAFFDKTENAVGDLTTRLADDRYAT